MFEAFIQALDHNLLFAYQLIDKDAALLVGGFHHDDEGGRRIRSARHNVEVFVETEHRTQLATHLYHLAFAIDGGNHFRRRTEGFANRKRRKNITLITNAGNQPINDRKCER